MSPPPLLPRFVRLARLCAGASLFAMAWASTACEALIGVEEVRPAEAGELAGAPTCVRCDGRCVAAQSDDRCGSCAVACGGGETCLAGVCNRSMRGGAGSRTVCLRDSRGTLRCRGANDQGQLGRGTVSSAEPSWEPALLADGVATFAVGGGDATCFLLSTGQALCSGSNAHGALGSSAPGGDGTPMATSVPKGPLLDLSAGPASETAAPTCGIEAPSTLRCWGFSPSPTSDGTQTVATAGAGFVRVETGRSFACVLDQLGQIQCLGTVGENAPSTTDLLRRVDAPPATAIAAGALSMCLIDGAGKVWCWGGNRFGQLGAGAATDRTTAVPTPVGVSFPRPMVQIVGGDAHFCALESGGGVACWGAAASVGDGLGTGLPCSEAPCRVLPERVPLARIVELAAAKNVTFARRDDGAIFAWGVSTAADCLLGPRCEDVTYLVPTRVELP